MFIKIYQKDTKQRVSFLVLRNSLSGRKLKMVGRNPPSFNFFCGGVSILCLCACVSVCALLGSWLEVMGGFSQLLVGLRDNLTRIFREAIACLCIPAIVFLGNLPGTLGVWQMNVNSFIDHRCIFSMSRLSGVSIRVILSFSCSGTH